MSGLCAGQWWLFDSTHLADHIQARAICAECPMRRECAQTVATLRGAEGTWAGRLYGSTSRERKRYEEAMFSDADARAAHAAWVRAEPADRNRAGVGDRVVTGERVYQARSKRNRRAVA